MQFSRAYYAQFSRTYDTHLPHNPNPTHRVAYTQQKSIFFVSIPQVFIFIWCTIYTHFHEIRLVQSSKLHQLRYTCNSEQLLDEKIIYE